MSHHLLALGCHNGWFPLPGADADAERVTQHLDGWADHVHLLTGAQVELGPLDHAVATIARQARPGDTVLVYASAHGAPPLGGPKFLATHEGRWSGPALSQAVDRWTGCDVLLVLDACCSGGLLPLPHQHRTTDDGALLPHTEPAFGPVPTGPARIRTLCGATGAGFAPQSRVREDLPPVGALSWALLDALAAGAALSLRQLAAQCARATPPQSTLVAQTSHPDALDAPLPFP